MSDNGNGNGVATMTNNGRVYSEKDAFVGKIVSHSATKTKNMDLRLIFTVKIEAKLLDQWKPGTGTTTQGTIPKEVDVMFTFYNDAEKMVKRVEQLSALGFDGDDLSKLIPSTKGAHSFKGVEVFVRPSYFGDNDSLYWNLHSPRSQEFDTLTPEESTEMIAQVQDLYKATRKANKKAAKAGSPF